MQRDAATVRQSSLKSASRAYSLPVFSSIGEPAATPPLSGRQRYMVVFGTRGRRIEVYKRSAADLNRVCERLGITQVVDVGRAVEVDFARTLRVPVRALGEVSGEQVSRLLLGAVAGVLDYSAAFLGKSTIFAAYCAHRVIPIVANFDGSPPADGLQERRHYWPLEVEFERLNLRAGQDIADNAFEWYRTHNLTAHARTFAACLGISEQPARIKALG